MKNLLKKIRVKQAMSIILIVTMIVMQCTFALAYNDNTSDYIVIQANKCSVRKGTFIGGKVIKGGIEDYSNAIFYMISGEDTTIDEVGVEKNDNIDNSVYYKNNIKVKSEKIAENTLLASEGTIEIKSHKFVSDGVAVIYSNKGDIIIKSDEVNFSGLIYAPNGRVSIQGSVAEINGCIIADSIKINSTDAKIIPDAKSDELLSFIKSYKNEGYMEFHPYIEEGNLGVYCDSNLNMSEGTIYVRYNDDYEFCNIGDIEGNQGTIENFEFDGRIDVIVEGRTVFGEIIESKVITLQKDEDGKISYIKQDSDNDGIEDGVEIYYLKSNPNKHDIDRDKMKEKFDKVITYIDAERNWVSQIYDFMNNKVKKEQKGDVLTEYSYDNDMNLVSKKVSYNGEVSVNNYEYEGEKISSITNNGYKYEFSYDDEYRIEEVKLNDVSLIQYEYSENGETIVYANGSYTEEKNEDAQVVVETGETCGYSYVYDSDEDVVTYKYENGLVVTYYYDEKDELKGVEANNGFEIEYDKQENDNGSVANVTYTICGDVYMQTDTTLFDDSGKVITSEFSTGNKIVRYYNEIGELIETITLNNKEYTNRITYGDNSRAETIMYEDGSVIEYGYDSNYNITSVKDNGVITSEYEYDQLNRLSSEKDYKNNIITLLTYDLCDNIKVLEQYEYINGQVGDKLYSNNYVYSNTYGDQLIGFNGESITYDESGKPLKYYDGSKFEWDGDKLIKAVVGKKTIEFETDNNGTVTKKTVDGVDTVYCVEGTDYIAEITGEDKIVYMYDQEAKLVGFIYNDHEYYYVKNINNDILKIIDSNGEFVCGYSYDAWGNITSLDGNKDIAAINKFRYRSYYYDADMEMYYLHSRYYDSTTARFISSDQIDQMIYNEDNLNLYAYCRNNPVLYTDPEGTAVKMVVFGVEQFKEDDNKLISDFKNYFSANGNTPYAELCSLYYMDDLTDYWNNLGATDYIVIDSHAEPTMLKYSGSYNSDEDEFYISEIDSLSYKYVTGLILLGCNAGHYDYIWSNVAYAFSKRISGCVIASDGTVESKRISNSSIWFYSNADEEYKSFGGEGRTNNGWVAYVNKRYGGTTTCFWGKMGECINIEEVMEYIKGYNYFRAYK